MTDEATKTAWPLIDAWAARATGEEADRRVVLTWIDGKIRAELWAGCVAPCGAPYLERVTEYASIEEALTGLERSIEREAMHLMAIAEDADDADDEPIAVQLAAPREPSDEPSDERPPEHFYDPSSNDWQHAIHVARQSSDEEQAAADLMTHIARGTAWTVGAGRDAVTRAPFVAVMSYRDQQAKPHLLKMTPREAFDLAEQIADTKSRWGWAKTAAKLIQKKALEAAAGEGPLRLWSSRGGA